MTKQITIYDLLPLLNDGFVACDSDGAWWWYKTNPEKWQAIWMNKNETATNTKLSQCFNIAPFDGDWKDSLIKVEHKEEE